jgi:hypothetical protein
MAQGSSREPLTQEQFQSIKDLAQQFNITKIEQKTQQRHEYRPLWDISKSDRYYDNYATTQLITMFAMEIEDRALAEIATKVAVYEELMEHPETRHLIRETMFIRKLQGR